MRSRKRIHVLFFGGRRFFRLFFLQQLRTRYGITGWTESKESMFEVFVNMIGYIWLHHCNGNSEVPRSRHIQTLRDYKEVSERTCYNKPLPILIAQKNWGPAIRLRKSMLRPFWRLPTSLNWLVLFFLPLFNAKCLQMESKDVLAIKVLQKVVAKCQSAGNAAWLSKLPSLWPIFLQHHVFLSLEIFVIKSNMLVNKKTHPDDSSHGPTLNL